MNEQKEALRNTFSEVINDYEYARPKYPQELYERIQSFSGIDCDCNILEVGAGTGQATDLFLQNNEYNMDLIEVNEKQADFLRSKYSDKENIKVTCSYFEDYTSDKSYDLIYSATAFHWVDSKVGYPKAWKMLRPGGTMAVFWQMSTMLYYDFGVFRELNEIKKKYLPNAKKMNFDDYNIKLLNAIRIREIQSGGYFGMPECHEFRWTDVYDADKYVALVNTSSITQLLEQSTRNDYLNEIRACINIAGGHVEMPQMVLLYLVKK